MGPDHIICMHSQTTLQSLVTCNSHMLLSTSTPWLSFAVIALIVVTFIVVCVFAIVVGHDVGGGS